MSPHAAARRHLARCLSQRRGFMAFAGGGPGPEPVEPALDALLAVGAISSQERAEWHARFARADEQLPEPDPGRRRRALLHLEELGAEARPAVEAFEAVGAITAVDAARWEGSQHARFRPMTPPSAEYEPAPPRFDDSVRRHAVLGPAERDAGVRVTVVELHDGGVTVYWHFACDDHEPRAAAAWERITDDEEGPHPLAEHEPRPLVVLADDRGTEYRRAASYYSYDPRDRCAHGRHGFAPAVPERATRLHVAIGDVARIAVPLVPDAQAS